MAKTHAVMQKAPIKAHAREKFGSRATQRIRAEGLTPGIIYGLGTAPVAISVSTPETVAVLRSGSHVIDIDLNGKVDKLLIQQVGYDYLQTNIEHIDLLRIDPKKKVVVKVSLEFRGQPKGAKEGGILETQMAEIEIEVGPLEIPSSIRVNVDDLELHAIVHAKDVALPPGATLITNGERIVAAVRTVKEEVAAVAVEATATEPEVIGKKKEEEGAEGAAPAKGDGKAAPKK